MCFPTIRLPEPDTFSFKFLVKLTVSNFHYNMEIFGGALNLIYTAKIRLLLLHMSIWHLFLTKFDTVFSRSTRLLYIKEASPLRNIQPSLRYIADGDKVHATLLPRRQQDITKLKVIV